MTKDVAIIGGSAAGFFTAYLLAQKGLRVRLFEASDSVAPCPRTLIVTSSVSDLIGSLCTGTVTNEIHHYELFADGRFAKVSLGRPDLVIERSKLIKKLATQAELNGAKVLTSHRFQGLKPNAKDLRFTVSRNGKGAPIEESTNILVGADGAFSKVAESAGWPRQSTVPLFQAIVELPKHMASDTTRVWFAPEHTSYFYWLIPHSPTHGVLGLISGEEREGRRSLERFLERRELVPTEFQSARIPVYTRWLPIHRKIQEGHVYLVGDAAAHVKASTLGGILTGFRGALGVAEAILNGGSSREFMGLRRELNRHQLIRRALDHFTRTDYARLLDLLNPSTQRLLGIFTRDETKKLLFRVLFRQPRLLFLILRSLSNGR